LSESSTPQGVRTLAARLREAGSALRALSFDARAEAIGRAAARLADPHDVLGAEAREALGASSEHAPAMVEWALATTLADDVSGSLRALCETWAPQTRGLIAQPARLAAVVLAGNVFTAGFRALALPLVVGAPTLVKASSRDDVFPRLFARALAAVEPRLGDALGIATFPGGDEACEAALFEHADSVSVYGSDATIAAVRLRLPPGVAFAGHGHGVGAAYVPYSALDDLDVARDAATRLALDVAAYDQRGCLSPHVVFVARSGRVVPREFSRLLADEGLAPLARSLPRGALPMDLGAQQLQWRGLGVVRGELFEGDGFAVSYEADGPLRLSPGYRNVLVLECGDPRELARRVGPLGVHLKALGVGGDAARRAEIARTLDVPLAFCVSALGTMQTPGLGGPADAVDPFAPFRRFLALD
jgi:hypothetical protein